MSRTSNTVTIEDARLVFRNFSGREGQYNRAGDRNFSIILDQDTAEDMIRGGWNVKTLKPRDEGDEPTPYITVSVSYKGRPPKICLVSSRGKTYLDEEAVDILDWSDFVSVDVILTPYDWEVNGKTGRKAYLSSMYATLLETDLDIKYRDIETL